MCDVYGFVVGLFLSNEMAIILPPKKGNPIKDFGDLHQLSFTQQTQLFRRTYQKMDNIRHRYKYETTKHLDV